MPIKQPYLLDNKIQHYAWGGKNESAYIPRLLGITAEQNEPYAELWMGVHPHAPSETVINGKTVLLDQLIKKYPVEFLGKSVAKKFNYSLPFLFKVLSAREALSIQAHPTRKQAKILHQKDPINYPDDNHKPEIAIALDCLDAIAGFKPYHELLGSFEKYPEMIRFIGENYYQPFKNAKTKSKQKKQLKNLYCRLMKKSITHADSLQKYMIQLARRLSYSNYPLNTAETYFLELNKKYPGDVGLFSLFLLNLIRLQPGEAIFLDSGMPHAYLKGNIIECMANSDNVVRAGLTSKFKDINTLTEILSYEMKPVAILGKNKNQKKIIYQKDLDEFKITRLKLVSGQKINIYTKDKPAIILIIEGKITLKWNEKDKKIFYPGQSIFIPAFLKKYHIKAHDPVLIFKATIP